MPRDLTPSISQAKSMKRLYLTFSCLVICILTLSAIAPTAAVAQRGNIRIKEIVDKVVADEMQRQKIVGVSVGVIVKSKVAYTSGYGFADIENDVPTTDETIINWASNSKPVVAVLAMQLVERKKLDLDATIDNYLPDLPRHLHGISARHLLCHQSGIPHYSNGKIIASKTSLAPEEQLDPALAMARFINSPLIFKPGEKKEYSSYAYILLSAVVQAAGGEPIASQLADRITAPLKLDSFQLDVPAQGQQNWSKAYRLSRGKPVQIKDTAHFWKHGAGAYKSNVKDFAAFAIALMKTKLMKRQTLAVMRRRQVTNNGKQTEMGLGVYVSGKGDALKVSHNGSQDETKTRMVIYPNRRHGIVVMCNCNHADPGKISTAIYNAFQRYGIQL